MSTREKQTSKLRSVNTSGGTYVAGNVFAGGDVIGRDQIIQYVTQIIGDEKDSMFTGVLKRIILAQNLTVGIIFSYMRGDPFPYARSLRLVALCISANRKEVKEWFKTWFSELDELLNNPKSEHDLNQIASDLWLATELVEISHTKNTNFAETATTLIADFQRIRSEIIESLSKYSLEVARKHGNLVHLQRVLHNSPFATQEHLGIIVSWIGLLTSYTNRLKDFTPTDLLKKIDDYIRYNPEGVTPLLLGLLSNIRYLLVWTIEWTSKNSDSKYESKIGNLLGGFPDLVPSKAISGGFSSSQEKATTSSIQQLTTVLQLAHERLKTANYQLVSSREEVQKLQVQFNKLTESNQQRDIRLSTSHERLEQKEKALQKTTSELKRLKAEHSSLELKQSELEKSLTEINRGLSELKAFLVNTENKTLNVESENQTLEIVTSLLNKTATKNQELDHHNPTQTITGDWQIQQRQALNKFAYTLPLEYLPGLESDKNQFSALPFHEDTNPVSLSEEMKQKVLQRLESKNLKKTTANNQESYQQELTQSKLDDWQMQQLRERNNSGYIPPLSGYTSGRESNITQSSVLPSHENIDTDSLSEEMKQKIFQQLESEKLKRFME